MNFFTKPKFMMMKKIYEKLKLLLVVFAFLQAINAQAQTVVTGKVSDSDNSESLPGVSVSVKGGKMSTSTDLNGNFKIQVPNTNSILVVSFIGYKPQEVNVGDLSTVNVRLVSDNIAMSEVVVVGYGTTKKVNLTGAVDVIKADRLENRPISNVGEGLQGLAPNLNVEVTSGDPSKPPTFNIRGFESINGGSPLILVDNVPMDLNSINPEDIKSVTILKDGAASAIYGARAAFGVILVETKNGVQGKTVVRLSSQLTLNKPIFNVDPIENGYEYALERNRIASRDLSNPAYDAAYIEGLRKYWTEPGNPPFAVVNGEFQNYVNTNLSRDLLSDFSPRQKYDLSVSGATDKASYYTSFGYFNTDGYLNYKGNDNFQRYNILAKGDYKLKKWLSFDQQITVNMERSDKPAALDIKRIIRNEPFRPHVVPLIPGFEKYEGQYWEHGLTILPELENGGRLNDNNSDLWLKSGLTATPLNGLKFRTDFSYNSFNRQIQDAQPSFDLISQIITADNPVSKAGLDRIEVERNYNQYYVFNSYLEYTVPKLKDHYLRGLVGYNQEWDSNSSIGGTSSTFVTPSVIDVSATTGVQTLTGGRSLATLRGAFYRLNYNYKERYLVEANGRYDGTSRFPAKDRFGFFPSFSAAWRISEETFMTNTRNFLDNLKIRGSYGSLGNQLLGNNFYPYIASLPASFSNFVFNSGQTPTVRMSGLVSPTLTWEKVVSKNLGLDVAMLDGRLESFFEVYTRDTKDMLMRKEYPDILGIRAPQENAADLRTTGFEFSAKWNDRLSKDFGYHVDFNLSNWTSKITKYDNPTGSLSEYYVGQQIGEIWGYETKGIIQTPEDLANIPDQSRIGNNWRVGDLEFVDQNGDGKINEGENTLADPGDLIRIGNSNPQYSFGLNTGVNYKGFSIDLFFQGIGKRDYMPSNRLYTWFFPWSSLNGDKSWLTDTWTPDNRDAYFPGATLDGKNFRPQTRFLQNAAYVRLKNLTVAYNLPTALVTKVGLNNVKMFLGGQNLFQLSKIRRPLDPEYVFSNSIDYPLFKSYTFGLVVNL